MSDSPISAVVVTGHYSAGKGPVALMLQELIQNGFPDLTCSFLRDRDLLDRAVLKDTARQHSIIKELGPPLVFNVKSGYLHDQVHRSMLKEIRNIPPGECQILEIASGPDVTNFDLYQSGAHLVQLVDEYEVFDRTLFVEVYASETTRFWRNKKRRDFVSEDIMKIAACSGGELSIVAELLGNHYWHIDNDKDGDNTLLIKDTYKKFIKPFLEGNSPTIEGNGKTHGFNK